MSKHSESVIVVRKRKGKHGGHHGGSWKIAYADFMTAMMAFFGYVVGFNIFSTATSANFRIF